MQREHRRKWQKDVYKRQYNILDQSGYQIASISKELLRMTDTYVIDVRDSENVLEALMFVLAMDAEKCSRN